jgi:hypothetical protein
MTTKREAQAICNDGVGAFARPAFSLLKVQEEPAQKERVSIMTTRKPKNQEAIEDKAATTAANQPVVQPKPKSKVVSKALVQAPLPEKSATKQPKAGKPKSPKADSNPKGHAWLLPNLVLEVIADKKSGMKNAEIASKHNISVSSIATIWAGPEWFKRQMKNKGLAEYPERG